MDPNKPQLSDLEKYRQRLLDEIDDLHCAEQFREGTFGNHELLDRTFLMTKMFDEFVLRHPSCIRNPEWFALAARIEEALGDLYRQIGVK